MFLALHTESRKVTRIYAVEGTMFLIFIEDKEYPRWEWRDMAEFVPVNEPVK